MPKSPEEMAQSMIANMPEKTGKPLESWLTIASVSGLQKHGEIVKYLKSEHGMTHGFANLVAHKHLAAGQPDANEDPVEQQYAGPKAHLKPIYQAITQRVKKFGSDVEISPKKSYVSFRRNKQFALIQPSTRTRVDLGINLKGEPAEGKLEASGSFNQMVSHRVRLESLDDIDDKVESWLKRAYQNA